MVVIRFSDLIIKIRRRENKHQHRITNEVNEKNLNFISGTWLGLTYTYTHDSFVEHGMLH